MTDLEKKLFYGMNGRSQYTAIPLKRNEDSELNPQPNFLVIDNVFNIRTAPVTLPDGSTVETECQTIAMRIVYRENLPEVEGKEASFREVVFDEPDNVDIPYLYLLQVRNQAALVENEETVNLWLSLFQFRGCLEGFQMVFDKEKSLDFLGESTL